jgi:hypothetical protein
MKIPNDITDLAKSVPYSELELWETQLKLKVTTDELRCIVSQAMFGGFSLQDAYDAITKFNKQWEYVGRFGATAEEAKKAMEVLSKK